jgi:GNAT superfamily N-acetyltransferase
VAVTVVSIAAHIDLVPVIARWHHEEWGHLDPAGSLQSWTDGLAERTCLERIPTTFVALEGSDPVGSAALVEHDMETRPDLTPWLAGVFVLPSHRHRGIASRLVSHAMSKARKFGVETLYLYTRSAAPLYSKLGWRSIGREHYEGRWVTLMSAVLLGT